MSWGSMDSAQRLIELQAQVDASRVQLAELTALLIEEQQYRYKWAERAIKAEAILARISTEDWNK